MAETWLQANRRVFVIPAVAAFAIAIVAMIGQGILVFRAEPSSPLAGSSLIWVLIGVAVAAGFLGAMLLVISRIPRIAYDAGRVKFFVRFGPPVEVPLEHVEAFLIGRGPVFFNDSRTETKETTTLIVRIAERAQEFHNVQTAPLLAAWCGNNATIRGTWTEPLGLEVVNRLNQRLYDVKQAQAAAATAPGAAP